MKKYITTIFLSAFLLFQIQPMLARFILPWFGGSSAVWSTCLLFFQTGLLIGYGYAHLLTKKFSVKAQVKVHLVLLLLSIIALPVYPNEWMKPGNGDDPVIGILLLLTLTVGFPYIMISSTAPLLQSWFSKDHPKQSPYRLYALSNLGSLIGLFAYPLLIEPNLNLKTQAWAWSAGYVTFIIFCAIVAKELWKLKPSINKIINKTSAAIPPITKSIWMMLAFMGTITLLSITNKLTQDVVVMPLLWILPLSLYLISYIIAFSGSKWYNRKIIFPGMILSIALILKRQIQFVVYDKAMSAESTVIIYCLGVFFICMALHGELARKKPDEGNLTLYYFIISVGGVLAGIFIIFIVPHILTGYWEIYIAFIGSALLLTLVILKEMNTKENRRFRSMYYITGAASIIGIIFALTKEYRGFNKNVISSVRNFYGVLKVSEENIGKPNWQRTLTHGDVMHGIELMNPESSNIPLTYYGPQSGIGLALSQFPSRADENFSGMKVGMIGLGTGTISAYETEKDDYIYYELNPQVNNLARKYFKYLNNSKGKTEVIIGDGRITLENELKDNGSNQFDVLAIDAFSGDEIPTHLMTYEVAQLYMKHLKSNGILAFHITNKYLDLMPVMCGMSESLKRKLFYIIQQPDEHNPIGSLWVLFTTNQIFLKNPLVSKHLQEYDISLNPKVYWTDDYSSLIPLFQ